MKEFPTNPSTKTRVATREDYDVLADIMYDAVRNGSSPYSQQQRQAWVPTRRSGADWAGRLDSQTVFVAELSDRIVGFISLTPDGYLDFAYVRPQFQGIGIFKALYKELEKLAEKQNNSRIWVHASLAAEKAFAAVGFETVKSELVSLGDQQLRRFEMKKPLKL